MGGRGEYFPQFAESPHLNTHPYTVDSPVTCGSVFIIRVVLVDLWTCDLEVAGSNLGLDCVRPYFLCRYQPTGSLV